MSPRSRWALPRAPGPVAALSLAVALLLPSRARGDELVAEAAFLAETLPPGGREVALSLSSGVTAPEFAPRASLALALGTRVGLTADVGVHRADSRLAFDTPSASLRLLLREAGPGRTGVALSLDFFGSAHSVLETEAGAGLGVVRGLGPVTVRAALWGASGVRTFSPHTHAGLSAALALGERLRALAEVVADAQDGERALSAGPTVKAALDDQTSVMAGALFGLAGAGEPVTFYLQVTRAL